MDNIFSSEHDWPRPPVLLNAIRECLPGNIRHWIINQKFRPRDLLENFNNFVQIGL